MHESRHGVRTKVKTGCSSIDSFVCNDPLSQAFGDEHLATADAYNNLGLLYNTLNDMDMATGCQHKALEIKRKLLGNASETVAAACDALGRAYLQANHYDTAVNEGFQPALNIRLALYGMGEMVCKNIFSGSLFLVLRCVRFGTHVTHGRAKAPHFLLWLDYATWVGSFDFERESVLLMLILQ